MPNIHPLAVAIPKELVYAVRFQDKPDYQGQHARYANLNCLAQCLLAQHMHWLHFL